ncbi:MAG: VPLPA-CTERM sorting domain-containing protein [Gammaproteobacteria bacterium]|nr:VPLPA-CTERM sorting domain-containing protein [Gammaproteobacteria bacterium]
MAFKSIVSATCAGLAVVSLNAKAVVIDFEEFESIAMINSPGTLIPTSARISDQYLESDGVLFSSYDGFLAAVDLGLGHATSGFVGVGGSSGDGLTYEGEYFRANFFAPGNTSSVAVTDFVTIRGDKITDGTGGIFSAFDINGVLLGSDSHSNVAGHTFTLAYEGIHSVRFIGSGTIALDDFTFNPVVSAVPIPAAVWLFSSGLLGLVGVARRKKG